MKHEHRDEDLLVLGAASVETRGGMTPVKDDEEGGWKPSLGLSDD